MNVIYNYTTTIWVSIVAQMYKFLVEKYFFQFLFIHVYGKNPKL